MGHGRDALVEWGEHIYNNVLLNLTNTGIPGMAATKSSSEAKAARRSTVAEYLAALPAEKRGVVAAARKLVRANIPNGYAEFMSWGVINWGIPLAEFANTYNGHPLCYIALGAQKNHVALYLMGGDANQTAFLKDEFKKAGKKFDMGKSCLRFKSLDDLELKSLSKVIGMVTPAQFLAHYKKVKGLE
jgi:uncharacterized protein YdhG (YjbR/CyaY superfamily)